VRVACILAGGIVAPQCIRIALQCKAIWAFVRGTEAFIDTACVKICDAACAIGALDCFGILLLGFSIRTSVRITKGEFGTTHLLIGFRTLVACTSCCQIGRIVYHALWAFEGFAYTFCNTASVALCAITFGLGA